MQSQCDTREEYTIRTVQKLEEEIDIVKSEMHNKLKIANEEEERVKDEMKLKVEEIEKK